MIAPVAIPPPTILPIVAIPEAIAAPVVPAVALIIVAADPPITAWAVTAAVVVVAIAPAPATYVEFLVFLAISNFFLKFINYLI